MTKPILVLLTRRFAYAAGDVKTPSRRHGWTFAARGVTARLILCALLTFAGLALDGRVAIASSGAATPTELTEPIEQLNASLVKVMKAGRTLTFQQRYDLLTPAITRAFNLRLIVESAAAERWASLPPAQQQALIEAFQRYAVSLCASYFDDDEGERFELLPTTLKTEKGDPIVKVKIVPGNPGDDVHVLSYTMQKNGSAWQATDVVIDGFVSFAAVKQAELHAILWSQGAPALLARLQQLAAELSNRHTAR
jgi:phospholipid transport system substrate-binding protein